jgi:hypothetical protein
VSGDDWVRAWATIVTTGLGASLAALVLGTSLGRAQEPSAPSAVVTTVDPCVPLDLPHFRRLLSIELGTSIDYQPEAPREPGQTWVHLSCAPGGVALQLQDGLTHKSMMRILDTASIAPAEHTRLLALAVAEFVVASWVELKAIPQPALRALGAPAQPPPEVERVARATVERRLPPPAAREAASSSWQIGLGAGLDVFSSHPGVLGTFSLRLVQAAEPVSLVIGGDVGMMRVPVVRVDRRVGTIDVLRASGLAAITFGGEVGVVSLWGGAGARFGIVRMTSSSELVGLMGAELLDAHGGPLVLGRVGHRFSDHFGVGLELELGVVTLPVEAYVREDLRTVLVSLSGVWFSAGLRAALVF